MDRSCRLISNCVYVIADRKQGQNVHPVKAPLAGYLDIVPNEGFNHIAFFSPANSTTPIWITSGEWEVTQISRVDSELGVV
jgi:dipeptidyl aminopeptidase